jgi:hypothetical protein
MDTIGYIFQITLCVTVLGAFSYALYVVRKDYLKDENQEKRAHA